jgi:hypothetical protein
MDGYASQPVRASDAERDHAVRALRDRVVEGRMSHDTFERRVDQVLRAQNRAELQELVHDLPPRNRIIDRVTDAVSSFSQVTARIQAAWRTPRLPRFPLPPEGQTRFMIGRGPGCDLILADLTVSRVHAELCKKDDGWQLFDLGSMNGTRLNGRRLTAPARVRVGDQVSFGRSSFVISA